MLSISNGALQNLRIENIMPYKKVGCITGIAMLSGCWKVVKKKHGYRKAA
jgi:hypothetical protein